MTTPSEKIAVDANKLYERYSRRVIDSANKSVLRHRLIGTGVGATIGAAHLIHAQKKHNDQAKDGEPKASLGLAGAVGALSGGYLGHQAGKLTGNISAVMKHNRAIKNIGSHAQDVSGFGSRGAANVSRKFWSKVPEEAHRKVKAVVEMARRGTEHKRTSANTRLGEMAKRHRFDPALAMKHASFHTALLARR